MKTDNTRIPYFFKLRVIAFVISLLFSLSVLSQDKTAYEIWNDMTEAGINHNKSQTIVKGAEGIVKLDSEGKEIKNAGQIVMFGGEKEGSSSLITRIMGPDKSGLKTYVDGLQNKDDFLRSFLGDFSSGKIRVNNVKDAKGAIVPFDLDGFKGVNFSTLSGQELESKFSLFLERGGDKSFSHISKPARIKIFNGNFPGLTRETGLKKNISYYNYKPLYGDAEKFIDAAHGTSVGWELNFIPQRSYGEFEYMIDWFRDELKNAGTRFEAPGHQWIVYPKSKEVIESVEEAAKTIDKIGEVEKNIQAYIVLKGIEGGAGIELANYKAVHPDSYLARDHSTGRGVIRLENNRFKVDGKDAFAIEFRAGVKSDKIRRIHQKFLVSRYAANEYDDLAAASSWTLNGNQSFTKENLVKRFNVSPIEASKFLSAMENSSHSKTRAGYTSSKSISHEYMAPLWEWENAPYLGAGKKEELRNLTNTYIKTVANIENPDIGSVRLAMQQWVKTSQISQDIENYLKPKQKVANISEAHIYPTKWGAEVDVNKIDFGIEYSARYPLKSNAEFSAVPGQKGKYEWQHTHYGYNETERKKVIENFAKRLSHELNDGKELQVHEVISDGHGHGLDIAYELKDKEGRKWRAEWDGIGRSYDINSKMVESSVRGGHVEIVTPKFIPNAEDMKKLYTAMEKENLIPSTRFGGGHINIDLKPFDGKPKQMARFLGAYLDNRDVMSMMFQHPGRQVGAEAVKVSQNTINRLKSFDGTEKELKQLLYNEKFFNTRVGRKTKNNQLNLLAYIQDVIPEELIHSDFDMKNDIWRRTFDVEPKIRKMEFRMFNAPRNSVESALQIKFTKALLNKALNETDEVFTTAGKVDYVALAKDPQLAFSKFENTMKNLGLDPKEYKGFLVEGLEETRNMMESPHFLPLEEKLMLHPEIADWGVAVEPRSTPISSEGRIWPGNDVLLEAKTYKQQQMLAREFADASRDNVNLRGKLNRRLEKMPLEVTISLDEIKKLSDQDALLALYYQKSNVKDNGAHEEILKKIFSKKSFQADLPGIVASSVETSPGYQRFILKNLPASYAKNQPNSYGEVYREMLASPDVDIRKQAITYLKGHPDGLEILLSKANTTSDTNVMNSILTSVQNTKVNNKNVNSLRLLDDMIKRAEDPASLRAILTLSKNLDTDAKKNLYVHLLDNDKPQFQKIAHDYLKTNFEQDYYLLAKERMRLPETNSQSKKLFGQFLNESKTFDKLSVKKLLSLPEQHVVPIAKKILDSPNTTSMTSAAISKALSSEKNLNLYQSFLEVENENADISKWAYKQLTDSKFFQPKDTRNIKIIDNFLASSNPSINELGFDLLDKVNSKAARQAVIPAAINSSSVSDGVKSKLYSTLLDSPELLKEVSKYDGVSQHLLLSGVHRDISNPGVNRTHSARMLSKLSTNGSVEARDIIVSLPKSQDKLTKDLGLLLYGNSDFEVTHKELPYLLSEKPLTENQRKLIQKGMVKHNDFLKGLSADDLKTKSVRDQLWLLYKHDNLASKDNVIDIVALLKKEPEALITMNSILEESHFAGKKDPFAQWIVSLTAKPSFKEIADSDISIIKEIASSALRNTDVSMHDDAIKLLKIQNISVLDFMANDSRFNYALDASFQNVLSSSELTPKDIQLIKNNNRFHSSLVSQMSSTDNLKSRTNIAQFIRKIPGSEIDKELLNASYRSPTKQISYVLKNRNSNYAYDAMVILSKSEDPLIKKNASLGLQEMMKKSRELTAVGDLDTREVFSLLYHKTKNSSNADLAPLLKELKNKDGVVTYINEILSDYSPVTYKKWVLNLLEDENNVKALKITKMDMHSILDNAISQISYGRDLELQQSALRLARNEKLLSVPEKAKIISSYNITEDSLDTLKFFATSNPKGAHYEAAIQNVFQNSWHMNRPEALKRKTAELIMLMPTSTVEKIIKNHKSNYGSSADELYILLGAAKHNSPVVLKMAKENIASSEPVMNRTANRVVETWDKKSSVSKAASRAKCIGRSIQNVLNRLTFR